MLLTSLAGCAHRSLEPAGPAAIAVDTDTHPTADLLVCPQAPEGFPADSAGVLPAPVRAAIIRLATAYAGAVSQLDRLIAWHDPGACGVPAPAAPTK